MHPYIHIFGREITTYGLMALLGIGVSFGVVYMRCRQLGINPLDPMLTAVIAIAGAAVGLVLLKPLIKLPIIIIRWDLYREIPIGQFFSWLFGEMVFYGGLLGGIAAALWFCKKFRVPMLPVADLLAPAIPIGHALGRIGCLLAGCCYGVEVQASHPFAVVYPVREDALASLVAPDGVPLLAVPLIESAGNLIIAASVLLFEHRKAKPGRGIALYGLLYGVMRFVLEFYRGDLIRGVYNGISTSQIISLAVVAASAVLFIWPLRKRSAR